MDQNLIAHYSFDESEDKKNNWFIPDIFLLIYKFKNIHITPF